MKSRIRIAEFTTVSVTGIITIETGLSTSSIFPILDSTTAIQIRKANNSTVIATFDTTNDRLGIGATPLGIFDVSASSSSTNLVAFDASRSISVINRDTTTNNAQGIVLRSQSTNGTIQSGVKLLAVNTGRTAAGLTSDFAILTNTNGTISEKMRVTSGGNVVIGGTSTGARLEVLAPNATVALNITPTGGATPFLNLTQTSFNVSMGIASPNTAVGQASSNFINNFNNNAGILLRKFGVGTGDYLAIEDSTSAPILYVKTEGRVVIGGTTANARLQINTGVATTIGQIIRGFTSQTADLAQWQNDGGTPITLINPDGRIVVQNGQSGGALRIGGDTNTNNLTNGVGKTARITVPTFSDITRNFSMFSLSQISATNAVVSLGGIDNASTVSAVSVVDLVTVATDVTGNAGLARLSAGTTGVITGYGIKVFNPLSLFNLHAGNLTGGGNTNLNSLGNTEALFSFSERSTVDDTFSGILFRARETGASEIAANYLNYARIIGLYKTHTAGARAGDLLFYTTTGSVESEKLRVTDVGNLGLRTTNQFGSGAGVFGIANAGTTPSTNPTAGGVMFVEAGALKYRGSSGTA